jgi:NADP-dependent 3-hydroxy acid dehydrogenase YdfG
MMQAQKVALVTGSSSGMGYERITLHTNDDVDYHLDSTHFV